MTGNRIKLLVVDDSPEDQEAYRRALASDKAGFNLVFASTGEEGLESCRREAPACVLLDYHLPDADGLELLTTLVHECGSQIAVIIVTGQGNEAVAVKALQAGAEDYLVKGPALAANLPQAVRAAVEKVTLRRQLEEQRRELEVSRNQLRVTLASIGDAVIATDNQAHVTFMNPIAEQLTGWKSVEAYGRPLDEIFVIVNEETRQRATNPALRALAEGTIVGLANHTILIAKDGREHPIDDSAAPIRDEAGVVFGAVLVFRDVTERRNTERSLLLQSRVLESMMEGVTVADEDGFIFYANPSEDEMFGYRRGELLGKHVTELNDYSADENQRRVREVMDQLKAGGTWTGEWRNRRKDGSAFTTSCRISTLEIAERRCLVSVQEDITDRRRLEDELQRRVNELAIADKRKDEFLAMLAHELRNPLAPIKNSLHILKTKSGDWHVVDQVRVMMERQVSHLSRLVDDLLDVSRITQGKVKLRLERLDLAKIVRESVHDHQAEYGASRVALGLQAPETPVWVTGDSTRITQVVDNFLTNALKFTNPGGEVCVSLKTDEHLATLSVRDNGIGIEPEILSSVFDVFTQADKTLDRSRGGMGLGLAVVKALVTLHGGTVSAHSKGLGHGTEMRVELPLEKELPIVTSGALRRPIARNRRRILIVEDNPDSAATLRLLLEVSGYEVNVANNGEDGVREAMRWTPDVVLCDIGLPALDGYSVARMLRNSEATKSLRLIALTGYGRKEDVARAHEAGFDDYIVKPADPEMLFEKLSQ